MRIVTLTTFFVLAFGTLTSAKEISLDLSSLATNEVNVTSDSTPGWVPTTEQRQQALKTVEVFLNALEGGRYREAYEMLTEINRRNLPEDRFVEDAQKFRALAGPAKFWRVLKVSWTKDPSAGSGDLRGH